MSNIVQVNIGQLRAASRNPNVMSETRVGQLTEFIKQVGFLQPIVVRPIGDMLFEIIDGHHRAEAMRRLGKKTIDAEVRSTESDLAEAIRLGMNRLRGEVDLTVASDVVADLHARGMDIAELSALIGYNTEETTELVRMAQAAVEDTVDSLTGAPDSLPALEGAPDDPTTDPTKPWVISLEFGDKKLYLKARRALKKAAGAGGTLEDGLMRLVEG